MFDDVNTVELESELVNLAGRIASAQCRFLELLAEFDAREGWAGPGIRSCAHWLCWRVGLSRRTGREQLRVARALLSLPLVVDAFRAGRLSYAKVRAITRIATPATERALLDLALAGTASHVERAVSAARAQSTPAADHAARRGVSWRWDQDGSLVLRARLAPGEGARLIGALQARLGEERGAAVRRAESIQTQPDAGGGSAEPPRADQLPADVGVDQVSADVGVDQVTPDVRFDQVSADVRAGLEHPPGAAVDRIAARRADALLELLAPDGGQHEVTVHLEVATGEATLDDGPPVPTSTAERLACDARVRTLIKDKAGNPLYLGRGDRVVRKTQLAALRIRDQHRCQFPGCDQKRFLHAHHIVHWWLGGPTDIDNLVLLCSFHHRLIHDHPYRLRREDGVLRVWRADGEEVTAQRPLDGVSPVVSALDLQVERHVEQEAIVPAWAGERMDLDAILTAITPETPAAA